MDSDLLTREQVLEYLAADPVLRRAASICVLPTVRCGDSYRFRRADLESWTEQQHARAAASE